MGHDATPVGGYRRVALPFITADQEGDIDPAGWLLDTGADLLAGSVWQVLPDEDRRFLATVTVLHHSH